MLAGGGGGPGGGGFQGVGVQGLEGVGGQLAGHGAVELGPQVRAVEPGLPGLAGPGALAPGGAPGLQHLVGDHEGRGRPIHGQARRGDLLVEQGIAVAVGIAFHGAGALQDLGLAGDEGRAVLLRRPAHGGGDLGVVVPIDGLHRPAIGLEPGDLVAGLGNGRLAVDGGVVVVEQHGQLVQAEAAGDGGGLMADALHQAAVAGDHPGVVVHQRVAEPGVQMALGHGHAHGGGDALAQGAGGGLDARRVAVFRVAGGVGAPLPEVLDLAHGHRLEPGEMEQRIEQHRSVAGRKHEAVAIRPVGPGGVIFEELGPEHRRHVGHAHGHALVPRFGLVDGVHREHADGVGHGDGWDGHRDFRVSSGGIARGVARVTTRVKEGNGFRPPPCPVYRLTVTLRSVE